LLNGVLAPPGCLSLIYAVTLSRCHAGAVWRWARNGDGFLDLAVGVPFENIDTFLNAGAVNMFGLGL
jgi:hypothetical protein